MAKRKGYITKTLELVRAPGHVPLKIALELVTQGESRPDKVKVGDMIEIHWEGGEKVHGKLPHGKVTKVTSDHVFIDRKPYWKTDGFGKPIKMVKQEVV